MTDRSPASSSPLGAVAARGVLAQGLSFGLGKVLVLVTTLILARLLTPDEFGLVTIALIPITYLDLVADLGISHAVVYLPLTRRRIDASLVLAVLVAAILVVLMVVAAPAVGAFFGRPDATPLLRALSATFLFRAFGQIPDALLRRDLRFRPRMLVEVVRASSQAVVTIAAAAAGLGPWAIVLGYLVGHLAWSVAGWRTVAHRPRWDPDGLRPATFAPLIRYGLPAAGNALLLALVYDLDYVVVGRALGVEALGYYTMAFKIPQALIVTVFYALSTVAFPVLVRINRDRPRLRAAYLRWMRMQTFYGAAAGVGLALVAPIVVPVVLGERWMPVVPALQGLAIYATLRSLSSGAFDLYKAVGRPVLALLLSLVRVAVVLPMLLLVVDGGIAAVAWGQAVVAAGLVVVMQVVACRVLGIRGAAILTAVAPAFAAAAGTAIGVGAARLVAPGVGWAQLALATAAGLAGAVAASRLAAPDLLRDGVRVLRRGSVPGGASAAAMATEPSDDRRAG